VAAWTAARALSAEACALARSAANNGVRLQAIKFVEASALMFTAALGAPGSGGGSVAAPGVADGVTPVTAFNALVPPAQLRDHLQTSLGACALTGTGRACLRRVPDAPDVTSRAPAQTCSKRRWRPARPLRCPAP
jgi:hypothetical protein